MKKTMKILPLLLTLLMLPSSLLAIAEEFERGMTHLDSGNLHMAALYFEEGLKKRNNGLDRDGERSAKNVLRGIYSNMAEEIVQANPAALEVKEFCERGLELGRDTGRVADIDAFAFNIWLAIYHYQNNDHGETKSILNKLPKMVNQFDGNSTQRRAVLDWVSDATILLKDPPEGSESTTTKIRRFLGEVAEQF